MDVGSGDPERLRFWFVSIWDYAPDEFLHCKRESPVAPEGRLLR
jgi:hypothetical protein